MIRDSQAGSATTVYEYVDQSRRPVRQVIRTEKPGRKKRITQRFLLADGTFGTSSTGVPQDKKDYLYRWTDLADALASNSDTRVVIVAGEKSAEVLNEYARSQGLPYFATTIPGGEGHGWPEFATQELLRCGVKPETKLRIIADNDETGYKFAASARESLKRAGLSAQVRKSASDGVGDDIVDHLAAGFELADLVPVGPLRSPTATPDAEAERRPDERPIFGSEAARLWPDTYGRFVKALRDLGLHSVDFEHSQSWQCPAHKDDHPSLTVAVNPRTGTVTLQCHSGCDAADICEAVGLTTADLRVGGESRDDLILFDYGSIQPDRVRWLWEGLVPQGELTLVAGRGSVGKSTLVYQVVADVTRGRLPGEQIGTPRNVLVISAEDSDATTTSPRLIAAGADRAKVIGVRVKRRGSDESHGRMLDLKTDLAKVRRAIQRTKPALIVFDPLLSRVGNINTHVDAEVREVLEPVVDLLHHHNVAAIGLIHPNKSARADLLASIMGSAAFGNLARSVIFVQHDPDDPSLRLVGQAKSNLGPEREGTHAFTIETFELDERASDGLPITTAKIVWQADDPRSARQIADETRARENATRRGPTVEAQVAEFIAEHLRGNEGFATRRAVQAAGESAGWSGPQIDRGWRRLVRDGLGRSEIANKVHGEATWTLVSAVSTISPDDDTDAY